MTSIFEADDLIRIAKRENNTKRSYLYVNPFQGKHIPVAPSLSLKLFSQLANKIEARYPHESILIIGFAETATAIGSAIAFKASNCKYYLNTTREDITDAEYLHFTESHSHAAEQRLVVNGLENCLGKIDRIVFAEDEVTTGNTIEKLIRILQGKYTGFNLKYGIISILNSMPDERLNSLQSEGIICDCLHRISVQYRINEINGHNYLPLETEVATKTTVPVNEIVAENYWNSRVVSPTTSIRSLVYKFVDTVMQMCLLQEEKSILILGTEEFMFPGMLLGNAIEEFYPGKTVRFHATTRSPIEICEDDSYPLHNRTPLESVYSGNRRTFIYNLCKYDRVFLVTDAKDLNKTGISSICAALENYGNKKITLIHWRDAL